MSPSYEIDDDPGRLDHDAIWRFLSTQGCWGRWRTRADVEQQIAGAWRVVGGYVGGAQVGFARAVSDGVALAYLADVYVLPGHRGQGIAQSLVAAMVDHGTRAGFRWKLHTEAAHDLSGRFGFPAPQVTMLDRLQKPLSS